MRHDRQLRRPGLTALAVALIAFALTTPPIAFAQEEGLPTETHDGLILVPDREVAAAYIDPAADLSVYDKIMIVDCYVAFKKDWQKEKNRAGLGIHVSASDMERIKKDTASLFRDVFTEKLAEDGGYEIVNAAGEDVLLVRPAIIDLVVEAPDTRSVARTRTYTTTAGAATLYVELYDSVTGDILARVADRRVAANAGGYLTYSNRVTNRSDARRMLGVWADLLREKLDELHGK